MIIDRRWSIIVLFIEVHSEIVIEKRKKQLSKEKTEWNDHSRSFQFFPC